MYIRIYINHTFVKSQSDSAYPRLDPSSFGCLLVKRYCFLTPKNTLGNRDNVIIFSVVFNATNHNASRKRKSCCFQFIFKLLIGILHFKQTNEKRFIQVLLMPLSLKRFSCHLVLSFLFVFSIVIVLFFLYYLFPMNSYVYIWYYLSSYNCSFYYNLE